MNFILKYFFLIFFSFLWFLGCSKPVTKALFDKGILKDDYRYGDLYRLSNLNRFRDLKLTCKARTRMKKVPLALYLAGDSFTEEGRVEAEDFISQAFFRDRIDCVHTALPKTKLKKILIIETVERHTRERFSKVWKAWSPEKKYEASKSVWEKIMEWKVPYDETMHQMALFGFDWVLAIKSFKSDLQYLLFRKVDSQVTLSPDGRRIFYHLETLPGSNTSGFESIPDAEIKQMVQNINQTYIYYRSLGFSEVFLAIIPNKSSIQGQSLGTYNRLIERITSSSELKMPMLNVIEDFRQIEPHSYLLNDSHWTCQGQNIWLDKVNEALLKAQ